MNSPIIIGIVVIIVLVFIGRIYQKRVSKKAEHIVTDVKCASDQVDNTEHFQPYMSVLANDVFRSDPSFDMSKRDDPPIGNYE